MFEYSFVVESEDSNKRLDVYLGSKLERSRTKIQNDISLGNVLVNGEIEKANYKLNENDLVYLAYEEELPLEVKAENIALNIVYEDEYLLVINKDKGMVVHPGAGNHEHTLVNALLYHSKQLSEVNGSFRPGIVHRLDKDTSGLMVCAKNDNVHLELAKQLQDKSCFRKYYALVSGVIPYDSGEINAPIGRDKKDRQKYCVNEDGKEALTLFTVLQRFSDSCLISCELKTGRTHQIRVHMAYIGYPVINDSKYGKKIIDDKGQYLHAYELSFIHPISKERLTFTTEIPEYMQKYIEDKGVNYEL